MPRLHVPLLTSFAYLRKYDAAHIENMLGDPRVEVLLDSGAFTAFNSGTEIKLDEYMSWLGTWSSRLFGYMALDKLQDPVRTDANLRDMLNAGLHPIPIHVFGDDRARMDWLFERSRWVACGGFRRPHRGSAPRTYIKAKMEWAAGRDVHWLGYTDLDMIKSFKPFSCDCASWTAGRTFGQMHLYVGAGQMVELTYREWEAGNGIKALPGGHRRLRALVAAHGLDPDLFDDTQSWRNVQYMNRVQRLNARAWVRYVLDVRAKIGTRLFIAMLPDEQDLHAIRDAIDWADGCGLLEGNVP
jgi:hypothetical protein